MNQKELTDALDLASRQYYNGQETNYTDTEFDLLLKELQKMEAESGIVYPNSPTIRVGSDIQDGFKKGTHPKPMLTIENVYDDEGLSAWIKSKNEKYGTFIYSASIKYDGISCELHYHNGVLVRALTRGDKVVGDDITENVKTIKSVPLVINDYPCEDFYVRGEILLPKSRLVAINEERVLRGEKSFANTRNACSGTIKSLDPKEVARRGLIFRAWDCFGDGLEFTTMDSKFDTIEDCGFFYEMGTRPELIIVMTVKNFCERVKHFKNNLDSLNLDYEYDSVVLKINSIETQDSIGIKDTRAVEWAIARKWNEEYVVTTKLNDVVWQVGRTGILTPVGILEPVECGGVVISNVTLHNYAFITEKDLQIGDDVKITRSGGVIPYVLGREEREVKESPQVYTSPRSTITPPHCCPVCGADTHVDESGIVTCTNPNCSAVVKGKILQFCSKECMDIRSIGESVVSDLVDNGLVHNVADLYTLNRYSVEQLVNKLGEGYGDKKVSKMLEEIENSKNQPWDRVMAGLSIPGVGKVVARTLSVYGCEIFRNLASENFLKGFDGVGDIMAHDIYEWWQNDANYMMVVALSNEGVQTSPREVENSGVLREGSSVLEGLTVCFTGSSSRFSGDDVEAFLENNGAKCTHSVSKKMNYLITGTKPGSSKVAKAEQLGVEIIDESSFYEKFGL